MARTTSGSKADTVEDEGDQAWGSTPPGSDYRLKVRPFGGRAGRPLGSAKRAGQVAPGVTDYEDKRGERRLLSAASRSSESEDTTTGRHRQVADLCGASLAGVNLRAAGLAGVNLRGANLSGATLTGADLSEACLIEVDLRGADMRAVSLHRADLRNADLRGADLRHADMGQADLAGANLRGADLRGTKLADANVWDANLSGIGCDSHTQLPDGYYDGEKGTLPSG